MKKSMTSSKKQRAVPDRRQPRQMKDRDNTPDRDDVRRVTTHRQKYTK